MKLPSVKSALMFFGGVLVSLIALRYIPADIKAKVGL